MAKVIAAERTGPGTRGRGSFRRVLIGIPLAALALVVLLRGGYSVATAPTIAPGASALRGFDPEAIGRLEQRAWANYYYRDWPRLFDDLLRMSREQFGLSLPQALYASYVATQAQVVWARQGQQDGLAEEYMRRFYELVREPAGGRYDPRRAAELEVRWWAVHRQREQYPDRSALARALAETYAELYQTPVERLLAAGDARAEAMDLSDRWIREGKLRDSPLLDRIAERLVVSYRALAAAAAG
jgi:hypothetical protein